jgi:hypothetical protein
MVTLASDSRINRIFYTRLESPSSSNNARFQNHSSWGTLHQTDNGYIQFGPANTGHAHIYTDRSNFYFNKQIQLLGGTLINQNDIRSNVFYDKNDTAYYLDPTNNGVSLNVRGTIKIDGDDNDTWLDLQAANNGNGRIRMFTRAGDPVIEFSDATNSAGQDQVWAFGADDRNVGSMVIRWNGSTLFPNDWTSAGSEFFQLKNNGNLSLSGGEPDSFRLHIGGTGYASTEFRAPLFRDSNNTSRFVDPSSTSQMGSIDMNNGNLSGVNHITINDPGPTEGISWAGGNLWRIAESPDDISTNLGGNLQIIQNSTRRATFRTDGSLNLPSGVLLSNVSTNWQQSANKTNLLRGGSFSNTLSNDTSTIKVFPATASRAAGNYWGGMYFMHLDPENSGWGSSYTGGQMWIGGRIIDTPGQERSALVFATNNQTGAGSHPSERMTILPDGNVLIGQTSVSYTSSDNAGVVYGGPTANKLHVNGSIQLTGNSDAIVFGRGTATFLKDEELGFGWGGGWYMQDGTYLRARNNKIIYTTGEVRGSLFRDANDSSYYVNPADGTTSANLNGDLYIRSGKIQVQAGSDSFTQYVEDDSSAAGRAQLLLQSSYSDLVVMSRNANSNKHGSTITLATQSTSNTNYAKWVIGQGQYQEGADHLTFAYGTNYRNPHSILGTDNANYDFQIRNGGGYL